MRSAITKRSLLLGCETNGMSHQPPFPQLRTPHGVRISGAETKKRASWARFSNLTGGELGIRTPDGLVAHTRLAGEHLRPLGQLSGTASR